MQGLRIVENSLVAWPAGCLFPRQPDAAGFGRRLYEWRRFQGSRPRDTEIGLRRPEIDRPEPVKTAERENVRSPGQRSYENEPRNSARSEPSHQRCWRG